MQPEDMSIKLPSSQVKYTYIQHNGNNVISHPIHRGRLTTITLLNFRLNTERAQTCVQSINAYRTETGTGTPKIWLMIRFICQLHKSSSADLPYYPTICIMVVVLMSW